MPVKRENRGQTDPECDRPAEELAERTGRPIEEFEYDGELPALEDLSFRVIDDSQ